MTAATQRILITNVEDKETILAIEPWGREYPVPPGTKYEIVLTGPSGMFEIEHSSHRITVFGWPGATLTVFRDAKEV